MHWHPRHIESFPNHSAWKGHQEVFFASSTHSMVSSELRSGCSGFPLAVAWNPFSTKTSWGSLLHNLCHCLIITVITSTIPITSVWKLPLLSLPLFGPILWPGIAVWSWSLCPFQDICCSAGNLKTSLETGLFNEKLLSGFYINTNECCCSTPERKFESIPRTLVKRRTTIKQVLFTGYIETKISSTVWAMSISYLIKIISGWVWSKKV